MKTQLTDYDLVILMCLVRKDTEQLLKNEIIFADSIKYNQELLEKLKRIKEGCK